MANKRPLVLVSFYEAAGLSFLSRHGAGLTQKDYDEIAANFGVKAKRLAEKLWKRIKSSKQRN